MRGEYGFDGLDGFVAVELPPHARRIRPWRLKDELQRRTTSACAENTMNHP